MSCARRSRRPSGDCKASSTRCFRSRKSRSRRCSTSSGRSTGSSATCRCCRSPKAAGCGWRSRSSMCATSSMNASRGHGLFSRSAGWWRSIMSAPKRRCVPTGQAGPGGFGAHRQRHSLCERWRRRGGRLPRGRIRHRTDRFRPRQERARRRPARFFERFWRGEWSRSRHAGGTGLGLSVVQAICKAHGGHAEVAARVGGGTEIRIRLPREDKLTA